MILCCYADYFWGRFWKLFPIVDLYRLARLFPEIKISQSPEEPRERAHQMLFELYISHIPDLYIKNKVTLFLQTHFHALVTPFERHLKSNRKVQGARVMGAATEPFDCSSDVSQRELREHESGFAETELLCS
jgi:hypothetical protein